MKREVMKSSIIGFFVVAMVLSMNVLSALAVQVGVLEYTVPVTRVNLDQNGNGSFEISDISAQGSNKAYAGVEFVIVVSDGVIIDSAGYSNGAETIIPQTPVNRPNTYYFACYTWSNTLTGPLTCMVDVTYTGDTETTLDIYEIKQYIITDNFSTEDYVTRVQTSVTLAPYSVNPSDPVKDNNALLSSLAISSGAQTFALDPAFGSATTDYKATVPNSVSSVTVLASAAGNGARIEGVGARALAVGENKISITVTAEDGVTMKAYSITVTRESGGGGNGGGGGSNGGGGGSYSGGAGSGANVGDEQTPLAVILTSFPFTDVAASDWFYDDVFYCWENGLVNGLTDTTFGPQVSITRGMVVTILYRAEGSPSTSGLNMPFSDAAEGIWYTDPIKWAADKGIVLGYSDGTFMPDRVISRQELAAILYRYAIDYKTIELPETREYTAFADEAVTHDYAKEPVKALYMAGVINGKPNNMFDPLGTATRAEFAAMMHRFLTVASASTESVEPEESTVEQTESAETVESV